ncbi:hypothetical protein [Streptomyces sp. M10]|uniref:hypothetical protein n=1 Tax=Streptomyces sp. M10 TaxID=412968 RepID=UPI0012FF4F78|nr:hypothetical protein [Streptomyces sp. M10]
MARAAHQDERTSALPQVVIVFAFTVLVAACVVTGRAGMLLDAWGWLACLGVVVLAVVAGPYVFRWLGFHRRPATWVTLAAALALSGAAVWGVDAVAAQVWKDPWTRYSDEYAGPGACLAHTPYGDEYSVRRAASDRDRLEVAPFAWPDGYPRDVTAPAVLRLHIDGRRSLTPADEASRQILRSHGCR